MKGEVRTERFWASPQTGTDSLIRIGCFRAQVRQEALLKFQQTKISGKDLEIEWYLLIRSTDYDLSHSESFRGGHIFCFQFNL